MPPMPQQPIPRPRKRVARGFMTCRPAPEVLPVLLTTFTAFLLLTLISFSLPISPTLYFLESEQANGVRFGIWGWCLTEWDVCMSPMELGFTWEPQIDTRVTRSLILYPISAILTSCTLIAMIPTSCYNASRTDRVLAFFATTSFIFSFLAFVFMIGIFGTAKSRFEKAGFDARYGPCVWMSLIAFLGLLFVSGYAIMNARTRTRISRMQIDPEMRHAGERHRSRPSESRPLNPR